jgi:hypothetical protein
MTITKIVLKLWNKVAALETVTIDNVCCWIGLRQLRSASRLRKAPLRRKRKCLKATNNRQRVPDGLDTNTDCITDLRPYYNFDWDSMPVSRGSEVRNVSLSNGLSATGQPVDNNIAKEELWDLRSSQRWSGIERNLVRWKWIDDSEKYIALNFTRLIIRTCWCR